MRARLTGAGARRAWAPPGLLCSLRELLPISERGTLDNLIMMEQLPRTTSLRRSGTASEAGDAEHGRKAEMLDLGFRVSGRSRDTIGMRR